MRTLSKEKKLNAIALLEHRCSTCEDLSKLLGISQSTCSRIWREYAPHVERLKGSRLRSFTIVQRRACIRAITLERLNIVVHVKNTLSEQLNVVVSTNTLRPTLHEACLRSLENQRNPYSLPRTCILG